EKEQEFQTQQTGGDKPITTTQQAEEERESQAQGTDPAGTTTTADDEPVGAETTDATPVGGDGDTVARGGGDPLSPWEGDTSDGRAAIQGNIDKANRMLGTNISLEAEKLMPNIHDLHPSGDPADGAAPKPQDIPAASAGGTMLGGNKGGAIDFEDTGAPKFEAVGGLVYQGPDASDPSDMLGGGFDNDLGGGSLDGLKGGSPGGERFSGTPEGEDDTADDDGVDP
ncbi:MAG TPA: hypothetical protein VF855_11010, partial [Acidimicrobiales bacterium]